MSEIQRGDEPPVATAAPGAVINLKSELIASRLALRRAVIREKRISLRRQVLSDGEVRHVEGPNDPQILFPEEVWLMIFGRLEEVNDLRSCFNTCSLFRAYLEPIRNSMLFIKVLPILSSSNRHSYLSLHDILNCRLVSKSMCRWIDIYFENHTFSTSWRTHEEDNGPNGRIPLLPVKNDALYSSTSRKMEMLAHPRNPFIGRTANAIAAHPCWVFDEDRERQLYGLPPANLSLTETDLKTCGSHIWSLCLCYSPTPNHSPSPRFSYAIEARSVSQCLAHCPKVRRFEIRGVNRIRDPLEYPRSIMKSAPCPTFPDSPYLSSLVLTTPLKYHKVDPDLVHMHSELVKKFSGQLRELRMTNWNPDYSQLDWSKLRMLEVQRCDSRQKLASIYQMSAVNLMKLWLILRGKNGKCLQLLLQTINHFPLLEEAELQFDSEWEILEQEIRQLPVTNPDLCSTSLKRLHVRTGFCDKITYTFLVYFPFLESLHISYGCEHLDSEKGVGNVFWIGHCPKPLLEEQMHLRSDALRKSELLELREYLYQNRNGIHGSSVWKILPFLRRVKITECWMFERRLCSKSVEYSRQG